MEIRFHRGRIESGQGPGPRALHTYRNVVRDVMNRMQLTIRILEVLPPRESLWILAAHNRGPIRIL